jgi:hypothetical protein
VWEKNEIVILRWDDTQSNQEIVGKQVKVVNPPTSWEAPMWMDVSYNDKIYAVRGSDCIGILDPIKRASEKAASRAQDAEDIRTGQRTADQVNKDNGAFAFPKASIRIKKDQ